MFKLTNVQIKIKLRFKKKLSTVCLNPLHNWEGVFISIEMHATKYDDKKFSINLTFIMVHFVAKIFKLYRPLTVGNPILRHG